MASSNVVADETAGAAASGIATGDAGSDARSEEDILGITPEDGTSDSEQEQVQVEDGQQEEVQPGAEQEAGGADKPAGELNPDEVASTIPAELKHLMSDAKIAPHLQRAFGQLAAYSALGTVRDARTFAEEFPGGVKEAQEYKSRALDVADWDAQYESGDATQQADLAQSWHDHAIAEGRPEVFRGLVNAALNVLKKSDPDGYKELNGGSIQETFGGDMVATDGRTWNLPAQMDSIVEAIRKQDYESLTGLSYFLVRELSAAGMGRKDQAGGRVPKELDQIKQREQAVGQLEKSVDVEKKDLFFSSVNVDALSGIDRSINAQVGALLKDTAFTEDGKRWIAKAVVDGIDARLKADRSFQVRFAQMSKATQFDPKKRGDLVNFIVQRAKALAVPVARDVIAAETRKFVAQTNQTNSKKTGARQRVDITGGQAGSVRGTKLTQQQIQGMTDEQQDALVAARLGI